MGSRRQLVEFIVKFARTKLETAGPVIGTRRLKPITDTKLLVLLSPRTNQTCGDTVCLVLPESIPPKIRNNLSLVIARIGAPISYEIEFRAILNVQNFTWPRNNYFQPLNHCEHLLDRGIFWKNSRVNFQKIHSPCNTDTLNFKKNYLTQRKDTLVEL